MVYEEVIQAPSPEEAINKTALRRGDVVVVDSVSVAPIMGQRDLWGVSYGLKKEGVIECKPSS